MTKPFGLIFLGIMECLWSSVVARFRRTGIPLGIIQVGDDLKLKSTGCDVITRNLVFV